MPKTYAKVLADSITEEGHRLVTFEAGGWRPILAEQNTHRVFSRNSASSRAIPVEKMLERFLNDTHLPAEWRSEKPGMQGGKELTGDDLRRAKVFWADMVEGIADLTERYLEGLDKQNRLHKSLLNRWLEPGLTQVQIISGTSWDGYFWQRCHEAADPNIRNMAVAMREAMEASTPRLLREGEWHLPLFGPEAGGHPEDWDDLARWGRETGAIELGESVYPWAKQISAGRCARVSYMNHDGVRRLEDDFTLFNRLADREHDAHTHEGDPPHASPLEHVATPWAENSQDVKLPSGQVMRNLPKVGNFTGWFQFRHELMAF